MLDLKKYNYIFYDIETTGMNPCFDQIVRFCAIETNHTFDIINSHNISIQLRNDIIPSPKALLVNKLSIDDLQIGEVEYTAIQKIHTIINKPNTINIGYNSLNFDDIFLRFGFYRNLLDPYSHQYSKQKSNNFRADVYNIILMYYLYKHDNLITWAMPNNRLSLQLEQINAINKLYEGMSHDAEVDVHVTIELAKKLKEIDDKMWEYLISNFIKNNDKNYFNKLPSITCVDNTQYLISLLVSNKVGLKSNYCAPVIYLCEHKNYKDTIFLLRLDYYNFENFTEHNFSDNIKKGIIKKKFGEPHFLIPFTDKYSDVLNPNIVSLAKSNIAWIKHHPNSLKQLIDLYYTQEYPPIDYLDIDASLYQQKWFSNEENDIIRPFHNKEVSDQIHYINNIPNSRIKDLGIRIMGRNYFDSLNSTMNIQYQEYLDSIFYNKPITMDFRGGTRANPLSLLKETKELLKDKTLDSRDEEILNSLKEIILLKIKKQQDLGF